MLTSKSLRCSTRFIRSTLTFRKFSHSLGSTDGGFEKDRIIKLPGDSNQREFTYFMLGGARFIYASTARLALIKVSFTSLPFNTLWFT